MNLRVGTSRKARHKIRIPERKRPGTITINDPTAQLEIGQLAIEWYYIRTTHPVPAVDQPSEENSSDERTKKFGAKKTKHFYSPFVQQEETRFAVGNFNDIGEIMSLPPMNALS